MVFKKQMRRMLSTFLAGTFVVTSVFSGESLINLQGTNGIEEVQAANYNLADSCQEGTILHCFDWKYNDIKAELAGIAEAGFTSIQTSPATPSYDPGNSYSGDWYWLYQPLDFRIATSSSENGIGTKAELKALCDEAEKYGIKVIVDVVANHLAGGTGTISDQVTWSGKNNSNNWHNRGAATYGDRVGITTGDIGLPDLNSSSSEVISSVKNYIQELKSIGVDGCRFDAAKHIAVPEEGDLGGFGTCNFWNQVTDSDMYNYGEILVGPTEGGSNDSNGVTIMQNYTKYISVTDSSYSGTCLGQIVGNRVPSGFADWARFKSSDLSQGTLVKANKLVYWAESHDTYSNDGEYGSNTSNYSTDKIDRAYALVASRNGASALYFSRPSNTRKAEIHIGQKGSTHYETAAVAEVNKFHNACNGHEDYYATNDGCSAASITRKDCDAFVVVKASGSGSVTVPNGGGYCTPGTYEDRITGNTFTVTATTITGEVGDSGIAVVYPGIIKPVVSASVGTKNDVYEFTADSLNVTLSASNVSSATYKLGSASAKSYKSGDKITISNLAIGDSVTLTLTGKAADSTQEDASVTYTYKRVEKVENIAYFKAPSSWGSTIYCYAYDSETEKTNNGKWPGQKMKYDSATGLYSYTIDESIKKPRVIFYNSDSNRTPADMEKGYLFKTDGSWKYENGTWAKYTPVEKGTVKVNYVCDSETLDSVTLTGNVGESYTTEKKSFTGYTYASVTGNTTGKYTAATQTVTYKYTKDSANVKSKVTVKYVCAGEVVKSYVIRDYVGTSYSVDKTIDGYTYVSYKGSSLNSVITKTPKSITITLKKNAVKNGFVKEDGQTYYYVNGVKTYAGLIKIDGSYYYINSKCVRVTGKYYVSKNNGLLPRASYEFDTDGKLVW